MNEETKSAESTKKPCRVNSVCEAVIYRCVNCWCEMDSRKGWLYHPKTRQVWFSFLSINCEFAGKYYEHPDVCEVKETSNTLKPNDI
jgi:hypothetical protein